MYFMIAFLTGVIIVFQFRMNSTVAEETGAFNGLFYNYLTGTLGFAFIFPFIPSSLKDGINSLSAVEPWMLSGSLLGVLIVMICNYSFSKYSASFSTFLIILGQLTCAIVVDKVRGNPLETIDILGVVMIVLGIGLNNFLKEDEKKVGIPSYQQDKI